MKPYKRLFNEVRSHADKNPFVSAWDYLEKYKNDPDVYISFTRIDKIGLNPQSQYNTPMGIYTYPLREFVKNYIPNKVDKYEDTIGLYAPFAGNMTYINFIKVKNKAHFVNDMYTDYGSNNYDRDIKILEEKYKYIMLYDFMSELADDVIQMLSEIYEITFNKNNIEFSKNYNLHTKSPITGKAITNIMYQIKSPLVNKTKNDMCEKILEVIHKKKFNKNNIRNIILNYQYSKFDDIVFYALLNTKEKNSIMSIWNITRMLAEEMSNSKQQTMIKWNLILSKDLGYSGFADKSGKGYIHPSEPMQAVFFNTRAFTILTRVENKPAKKIINTKLYKVGEIIENPYGYTITIINKTKDGYKVRVEHNNKVYETNFSEEELTDFLSK